MANQVTGYGEAGDMVKHYGNGSLTFGLASDAREIAAVDLGRSPHICRRHGIIEDNTHLTHLCEVPVGWSAQALGKLSCPVGGGHFSSGEYLLVLCHGRWKNGTYHRTVIGFMNVYIVIVASEGQDALVA